MVALEEKSDDHQSHDSSSRGEHERTNHISSQSVMKVNTISIKAKNMWTSWWRDRGSQGLTGVSRIHPLRSMNVWTTFHANPSNYCWGFSVWTKLVDKTDTATNAVRLLTLLLPSGNYTTSSTSSTSSSLRQQRWVWSGRWTPRSTTCLWSEGSGRSEWRNTDRDRRRSRTGSRTAPSPGEMMTAAQWAHVGWDSRLRLRNVSSMETFTFNLQHDEVK